MVTIKNLETIRFRNTRTGKLESDLQHLYYTEGYCKIPLHKKRNAGNVIAQMNLYKKRLHEQGKKFPQKNEKIYVYNTVDNYIKEFEWEKHYLESIYEESKNIDSKVIEFQLDMLNFEIELTQHQKNILTALQNIVNYCTVNLDLTNRDNITTLTSLGYLLKALKSSSQDSVLFSETMKDNISKWQTVKESLRIKDNEYVSEDKFLQEQLKLVNSYFEEKK